MLNARCKQLLIKMMHENHPIKILDLAQLFHVSDRTIRNDLDMVDEFLSSHSYQMLRRTPKVGVEFAGREEDKREILELLDGVDRYHYILSPEERMKFILTELLQQRDYITISDLAERLLVCRGTVIKDLKETEKWLKKYQLTLQSVPKHGIKVAGEERSIRQAVSAIIRDHVNFLQVQESIKNLAISAFQNNSWNIKVILKDDDAPFIESCIREVEKELKIAFSDAAFFGLMIHIGIAILRIRLGKDISMPEHELLQLVKTREYAAACKLAQKIEKHFDVQIPECEIGYITIHLLGGNVTRSTLFENKDWLEMQFVVDRFIRDVSAEVGINLVSDYQLFASLMDHLRPAFYRLKYGVAMDNPLVSQIKTHYCDLFNIVKRSISSIEKYIGKSMNDDEIAYLVIHIGAALERRVPSKKKAANVLVVCGSGIGTAKLLAVKLENKFDVNIVGTAASHEVSSILLKKDVDVIVSTMDHLPMDVPYIQVSPFLNDEDIARLKTELQTVKQKRIDIDLEELIDAIKEDVIILNYDHLIAKLSSYLKHKQIGTRKGVVQPMLSGLLTEKTVCLNVDVKDWEDAVRKGGSLLEENGFIEPQYITAMIQTVKEIGPYIVIAPGIALPHARPESGVKKVGLSLITLKNPVNFGHKQNDPVRIVICLCAIDHSTHLKALSELVQHLNNPAFISLLMDSTDKREILNFIQKEEEVHA